MIANLPINLPDAEPSRPRGGVRTEAEGADAGDAGLVFAELLAPGQPADPAAEAVAGALANPARPGLVQNPQAAAAALLAGSSGKILPPGGADLPTNGAPAAPPGEGDDQGLARMLDMMRALQGPALQAGDEPPGGAFRLAAAATGLLGEVRADPPVQMPNVNALAAPHSTASPALAANPVAATTSPALPIPMPPTQPEWAEAVGQRVLWMVSNKTQHAQLRLNPPELGPVEVRVRLDDDGLKLSFAAGNAGVREALESAAPRLREMLQAEGLQLEQLDIGQRQAARDEREHVDGDELAGQGADEQATEDNHTLADGQSRGVGLVDVFV